ncbi:MAG: hypothetical protein HDT28_05120 [Clostridiales bacterium]|nr:hypothetical protein [Clostridiales bacterium]
MDRATRALSLVEDGNANLEKVRHTVTERTTALVLNGKATGTDTSFGTVSLSTDRAIIVRFLGEQCRLVFCYKQIAIGTSPIIAVLPAGEGDLKLSVPRQAATAVIFGGQAVT